MLIHVSKGGSRRQTPGKQTLVKLQSKFMYSHERKCIWNYRLENDGLNLLTWIWFEGRSPRCKLSPGALFSQYLVKMNELSNWSCYLIRFCKWKKMLKIAITKTNIIYEKVLPLLYPTFTEHCPGIHSLYFHRWIWSQWTRFVMSVGLFNNPASASLNSDSFFLHDVLRKYSKQNLILLQSMSNFGRLS